jgi:hypothetical protein
MALPGGPFNEMDEAYVEILPKPVFHALSPRGRETTTMAAQLAFVDLAVVLRFSLRSS